MRPLDLRGWVVPAAGLAIWEIWASVTGLDSYSMASPSQILAQGGAALFGGEMLQATAETLACAIAGLALGFAAGTGWGILLGLWRPVDRLTEVSFELLRPIPSVALIPIALLVFGFGFWTETAIVAFTTFWPALVLTRAAVRGVEPRLFEVARSLNMSRLDLVRKIVVPAMLPRSFVALRLAASVALIVAVTVEISANPIGMGAAMMRASQSLQPGLMFAYLFWIGFVGWALNRVADGVQAVVFRPMGLSGAQG